MKLNNGIGNYTINLRRSDREILFLCNFSAMNLDLLK